MQGLNYFRMYRKRKPEEVEDPPVQPKHSTVTSPAELIYPTTPPIVRNTSTRVENSTSTQSSPAPSTRPFSVEISTSNPSTPISKTKPVSEAISASPSSIRTSIGRAKTSPLKPINPPLDRTTTAPTKIPTQASIIVASPVPSTLSFPELTATTPTKPAQAKPLPAELSTIKVISQPVSDIFYQKITPATLFPAQFLSTYNRENQVSINSDTTTRRIPQSPSMMSLRLSSSGGLKGLDGTNSVLSPPQTPKAYFRSKARISSFTSSRASVVFSTAKSHNERIADTSGYKIGLVQESAISSKKRSMAELGAGVYWSISNASYVSFLECIRSERLTTLPHKGSRWDKVLIRALYFAEQLHNFDVAIQGFAVDSTAAAAIGYGHAQLLLEMGQQNSKALDKVFSVFYEFVLSFSSVLHRSELLTATPEIREQLCLLYTDLISLVVDVAIKFYKAVNGMTLGSVSLDIFEIFSDTIETCRARQNTVVELIWQSQIENEEFEEGGAIDVKVLSRWLAPQDRVLATLSRDHSTFVDQQVEFTCLWFQKHLSRFVQSDNAFLLITGQPGAGKTTLAGSIVERLQRPINRNQFDTLFCSLTPDIPTTATSLAVVKSLLFQLLNVRIGNMAMYSALFRAYHQCRNSADLESYEEHLWQALAGALKQPLDGDNDIIMVVDGLDDIANSQSASIQATAANFSPSALLKKLVSVTNHGRGVRLITLSSSVKMPSGANGTHHQLTHEDVRDDMRAVALRALIDNHHFHSKPGNDQEALLDRMVQAANGSFLWTMLVCEILNFQKSGDDVTKTLERLESSKPSVQDLVLKLYTSIEITSNAKTVLSWILAAERPLTIEEIHILFTVDVQGGTLVDKGVNVKEIIRTLGPLLTLHERIVRFRHSIIHSALHHFAIHNNVPIPLKESETDLLLRVLTYAKFTLRDMGEPLFDNSDLSIADRLFRQHHLLEYTVRYWVLHLQQSPLAPKSSGEFKLTPELQEAFPDTTILPILEQLCWDSQLPIPQAVDMHKLAIIVRREVFTENHPSVLQTYLAVATCNLLISNTMEAQKYFYLSTKISCTVLSEIHPLTLECANQFLKITETLTTTTRTEIMTHREEVLIILVTAYERQYGSTSEQVIQTRKLLIELYASIDEEDRAMEVYRLTQEDAIQQHGWNSNQAQEVQGHLSVLLHNDKGEHKLGGRDVSFFSEEDEKETVEIFDIASIVSYLRRAESHVSRKEFALAEKTYVELWMEVSSRCRTVQSVEWHEMNIEVATAYSQFLTSQKRTTEASAVLTCVWQQYEHHQLSFSEGIVLRLTSVAKEMKTLGFYSMAISIFKHANSYYKNVRQEESYASQEISKEVFETSSELVKLSLNSSTTATETTTTVSESIFQDVFASAIASSKTVDSNTMSLSRKLTSRYMEQMNWSAAIHIIQTILQRIWSSFLSSSINNVTMSSTFTQESVELVERLAECYIHVKQVDKVEDTYSRFFRAVLVTQNVDKVIFEKAKTLLITFYDKHGYADNAISVFQEILVVYRTRLGPSHESTIQTLYTLAHRCRSHPRNHFYWIEYYLQIISSLNKDSNVCHKDALDAMMVVTSTYWEDRRYAEAVTVYRVLWNTFVRKTTEHKLFSDTKFVHELYERYSQCIEETKASWKASYQVTKEYREKCVSSFGAESTIAVEATLSLAQVTQQSEEHASEAIALYEEVSNSSKTTATKTSITEIKQALSSLYVRQMQSQSSSSFNAEIVQRAISMTEEQFTDATTKYGYSHESSLTRLRELAVLYHRQQKTDLAVKMLTTAVSEIITKETSSEKLIESAASIASSFHACEQTNTAHSLVQELHLQICARDARFASKWSFDLTKSSRSALAFLASLQYNLREDLSITFAEIMADLTMEYIYFEQFRQTLLNNGSLTNVLLAAAPLRWFLRRNNQQAMITFVEEQAVTLFIKSDAQDIKTLSKESPRIFIIGILDHLGNGKNKNFNRSVILASNENVLKLTKSKKFAEANDIANLGFLYASNHDGYNGPGAISMGFKLASLLVGRDGEKCHDAGLRKKMLELSNRIVKKILNICKSLNVNFAKVQLFELSHLSILLGKQQDYETLEWLLTALWNTRDAQHSWPAQVLLNLGRRLICARYLAGQPIKAIRLCEDIAYNMRRAHGARVPSTIETYELLAQLYTSTAQEYQAKAPYGKTASFAQDYFKQAFSVHEDILRLMVHEQGSGDDSDEELDNAAALLKKEGVNVSSSGEGKQLGALDKGSIDASALALRHFHLWKLAYQRLGTWPKPYDEYQRLNAQIFRVFGGESEWKGVQGTEKWSTKDFGSGKAESHEGEFKGIVDWAFGSDAILLCAKNRVTNGAPNGTSNGASNGAPNGAPNGASNGVPSGASNGVPSGS